MSGCGIADRMARAISLTARSAWRCGGSISSTSKAVISRFITRTDRSRWYSTARFTIIAICGHQLGGARASLCKTDGDGETIVHLYEEYGRWRGIEHLRGMFAIALVGQSGQGRLLLARDRFGQKPLYYYQDQHVFVFASEIKALLAHPDVPRVSRFNGDDPSALEKYLSFGYVPAPETAFDGIEMLEPAMTLEIDLAGEVSARRYWELELSLAPPDPAAREAESWLGELGERSWKMRLSCGW